MCVETMGRFRANHMGRVRANPMGRIIHWDQVRNNITDYENIWIEHIRLMPEAVGGTENGALWALLLLWASM